MGSIMYLQEMLNQISVIEPTIPKLVCSGVFDEDTLEAVMVFQRDHGLNVTGTVDQATWEQITAFCRTSLLIAGRPPALDSFPNPLFCVSKEQQQPEIGIAQAMLHALAQAVTNFEPCESDARNAAHTCNNLMILQQLANLEVTGELNRATWAMLSALYRTLVTRRSPKP